MFLSSMTGRRSAVAPARAVRGRIRFCTLQSITLPEGLTTIGEYAFFNCSALKSVKIPGSVTSVKNYAFWSCTALTDVTVAWNTPLAIDPNVFKNVTLSGVTLRVPAGKGPAYQAANV